ncbi:MAG: hypothetical protein ACI4UM_08485 [Succinivibrio sp.]
MTIATLQNFSQYQRAYYEALHRVPSFVEYASVIEPFLKEIAKSGEFYIRVHSEVLCSILHDRRIKNAIESSHSASFGGASARIDSTRYLFCCNPQKLKDKDYPRFGYLSCADRLTNYFATAQMGYQYGMCVIRLKKSNLIKRTTMTVGSSMDFGSYNFLVPTMLDEPKATCIVSYPNHPFTGIVTPVNAGSLRNLEIIAKSIENKELTKDNYFRIDDLLADRVPSLKYFELQFHGEITTDDIECIDVEELDPETEKICHLLGISIEEQSL